MNATLATTKRQAAVIGFLRDYQHEHGCAPSLREIADGVGLKSASGIHRVIHSLQDRGVLERPQRGTHRIYEFRQSFTVPVAEAYLRLLLDHIHANGTVSHGDEIVHVIRGLMERDG